MGVRFIGTPVFNTPTPFPCEDNDNQHIGRDVRSFLHTESFQVFDEILEHIGRAVRSFLHTESVQILDILCLSLWTVLFNSNHRFSMGFKSRD